MEIVGVADALLDDIRQYNPSLSITHVYEEEFVIDDDVDENGDGDGDGLPHREPCTDPYTYVISANIQRRHLTSEQKRELIEKLLKAKPEQSNNQIAKQVKVNDKTVAKVRTGLEATSEIPKLKKTIGKDGKERPARKSPAAKPKASTPPKAEQKVFDSPQEAHATKSISAIRLRFAITRMARGRSACHSWEQASPQECSSAPPKGMQHRSCEDAIMTEYFEASPKKGRGLAAKSRALIQAMYTAAEAARPITVRGVAYKLFPRLIQSMAKSETNKVSRLLKEARERGTIPWEWIVDETRELERKPSWKEPAAFIRTVSRAYVRDFWHQQPVRVEVWSEKGTVRGVLAPVLDKYGVGFRVMHGFSSATTINDVAQDNDGRPLVVLYCGDWDPSGMCMSERDLPDRIEKYGGDHVEVRRIALTEDDIGALPSFPAKDKKKDTRYKWFVRNYGDRCWELDAMDPNALRARVEEEILAEIEPTAWERCAVVNKAEQESLRTVLDKWGA